MAARQAARGLGCLCRARLRVLPVVQIDEDETEEDQKKHKREVILEFFRAAAASWATAKYQADRIEVARIDVYYVFNVQASNAADAAYAAAVAARVQDSVGYAVDASFAAAAKDEKAFWSAVSSDATRIGGGAAPSVIAGSPLWPNSPSRSPYGVPQPLWSLWQRMKEALLAANED